MTEARLKVSLIASPDNPLAVIYSAYRQCYSSQSAAEICAQAGETADGAARFVQRMVLSGHESPLEHVSFTFAVEGISRAATHQLVRHRIASFSQQSQRYVNEATFEYIVPPVIARDSALLKEAAAGSGEQNCGDDELPRAAAFFRAALLYPGTVGNTRSCATDARAVSRAAAGGVCCGRRAL